MSVHCWLQGAHRTVDLGWLSAPPQPAGACAQGRGGACPLRESASATWGMLETTAAYVMKAMSGVPPSHLDSHFGLVL